MCSHELIARRLRILGRVQGVWYRDSMRREADSLGVVGWVRNLGDGSVEAWVEGSHGSIEAIIAWAHVGPPHAQVAQIEIEVVATGGHREFMVL